MTLIKGSFTKALINGIQGFYIHPNLWHEDIFPLAPKVNFMAEPVAVGWANLIPLIPDQFIAICPPYRALRFHHS